ncbi:MAG: MurR/RpiR family transcriptional regulator [Candidatus Accumulibacter sp.]|jgi:DNA-binding MurR/RpiR family transcriptional regulator|nr:MurR/RpiR family transcriptional regulator [Accumulibacter sp.]
MPSKSAPQPLFGTMADRIARSMPDLTPSLKRMAEYVLAHSFRAATMTIDELAAATKVSMATANRFARVLGFSGYQGFRAELVRGFETALAPAEPARDELTRKASSAEVMAASLSDTLTNLEAIRQGLSTDTCEHIVTAILDAHQVLVAGFGDGGYLAGMMAHGLELYCPQVRSLAGLGGPSHGARTLFRLSSRDVLVVISFPRYVKDSLIIAHKAKARGARIVALTDSPVSPLAALGDLTLLLAATSRFAAASNSTLLAVIEALCAAVARRARNSVKSAADATEFIRPWLIQEDKPA